jgi:hypothetical protein
MKKFQNINIVWMRKYIVVIAIVLPVLILVLIRSFGTNHFKAGAKKWAEPSVSRSNIISQDQIGDLPGKKLIINLEEKGNGLHDLKNEIVYVRPDSVLSNRNLTIIQKNSGPVLLFSSESGVSAKVWMLLSQLGYTNIYILTADPDNEVIKNKFRPDTLVRPEF